MRSLIIEDEAKTASYLRKGLTESGFVVDTASDGEEGLHQALENVYDVIVCDVMLPRMDGWAIVSRLRERGVATPILLLTARDAVPDRVRGLELGADDYLVKPFAFSELLARIRTVLRRGGSRPLPTYRAADVEVDVVRHRATRGGRELNLSPKEFALLLLFVRRAGEVLSRTIIGQVAKVAPIDKLSVVVAILLAAVFLHERLTWQNWVGGALIVGGTLVLAWA